MQMLDIDVNGPKTWLALVTYVGIDCRIDYPYCSRYVVWRDGICRRASRIAIPLYNSEELKQFQKIVKKYGQTLYPPYYLN